MLTINSQSCLIINSYAIELLNKLLSRCSNITPFVYYYLVDIYFLALFKVIKYCILCFSETVSQILINNDELRVYDSLGTIQSVTSWLIKTSVLSKFYST